MLKIVKIFQQTGTDHKTLLIVSCSIYSFLIWVSETNQTVFFKIRPDIWMLKRAEIVQHFSKYFTQLNFFLVPSQCFLFFYLASTELVFLDKTNYSSNSKMIEILHQNIKFEIFCSIIVPQWKRKKLFLYKAQIYLPTEHILDKMVEVFRSESSDQMGCSQKIIDLLLDKFCI